MFSCIVFVVSFSLILLALKLHWMWLGLLSVALTFVSGCALLVIIVQHMSVGGDMANIAALRANVKQASYASAHDIYGQASAVNQSIQENRFYRSQWWARDFVPAQWDTVRRIDIP